MKEINKLKQLIKEKTNMPFNLTKEEAENLSVITKSEYKLGRLEERERILKIIKAIRNGEIDLRYLEEEIQKEEE